MYILAKLCLTKPLYNLNMCAKSHFKRNYGSKVMGIAPIGPFAQVAPRALISIDPPDHLPAHNFCKSTQIKAKFCTKAPHYRLNMFAKSHLKRVCGSKVIGIPSFPMALIYTLIV